MRIYLDNCCFNRPFDDHTQIKIHLETQAKLHIQAEILGGAHELVWPYVLEYENSKNPFEEKKQAISPWKDIAAMMVSEETEEILVSAESLEAVGIKAFDALHIACAEAANCDYFVTTDKKLLNVKRPGMKIINPVEFIDITEI